MHSRFNSLTKELLNHRKAVHELCRQFSRSPSQGNLKRLRALFGQCGEQVIIEAGFHMDYGTQVVLGDRVYINVNCTVLDGLTDLTLLTQDQLTQEQLNQGQLNQDELSQSNSALYKQERGGLAKSELVVLASSICVAIGDDCLIGPNVQLLAVSHDIDPTIRQAHKHNYAGSIRLGNNVWLGGGVIVLSGVKIGDNSVIGAGSVVTKDVEANSVYAGNPAKKIRTL